MNGLSAALRIARRDAWQHRGRAALIVAMIALPVSAGVAIDVIVRSGEMTLTQQVQSALADADAWIVAPEGVDSVEQSWNLDGQMSISVRALVGTDDDSEWTNIDGRAARPEAEIVPLLPDGAEITPWQHLDHGPVKAADGQYLSVAADLLDIRSAAAGGRYGIITGTAPATADQIAVTSHLASRLDVRVGDTIVAGAPAKDYVISALVSARATAGRNIPPAEYDALVTLPGALGFVNGPFYPDVNPRYLVTSPQPITLPMIAKLNSEGIGVFSNAVATDPVARAAVSPGSPSPLLIAGAVIGVVMAIMQVVFLAGPAFAIGARRMRRQLGQLTATGARPRQVGMVVLATGVVLGAVGSLIGLAAGIGAGALLLPVLREWVGYKSVAFRFIPAEVFGVTALGVATAVLAALIPALATARTSPLALLGRQPATSRRVRWWSLVGAVLAGIGVAVTVWMAVRTLPDGAPGPVVQNRALGLATGVVLVEIGLLLAVPLIVHRFARIGALLPLAGRLALRDAERHRGRTAPAIAAVTVCATAAVMLAVLIASAGKNAESRYQAGIPAGDVQVRFNIPGSSFPSTVGSETTAATEAAIREQWPSATTSTYFTVPDSEQVDTNGNPLPQGYRALAVPLENLCPYSEPIDTMTADQVPEGAYVPIEYEPTVPTVADKEKAATDWRCTGRSYSTLTAAQAHVYRSNSAAFPIYNTRLPTVIVGGPELLRVLTGASDPAAEAALDDGGAVVIDRTLMAPDGTIRSIHLGDANEPSTTSVTADGIGVDTLTPGSGTDPRSIPAVLGDYAPIPLGVVLSPQAAHSLGWQPAPAGFIIEPGTHITQQATDNLALAIEASTGAWNQTTLEHGRLVGGAANSTQPLTALLAIIALLAAATVIVVTALGLADARPDYATLAAVGAPPRIRRLATGWTAATITFLGCLTGGVVGFIPAWGILRLMQTIQRASADPIIVPWLPLTATLIAAPLAAFTLGTLLPRSRLPMVARTA